MGTHQLQHHQMGHPEIAPLVDGALQQQQVNVVLQIGVHKEHVSLRRSHIGDRQLVMDMLRDRATHLIEKHSILHSDSIADGGQHGVILPDKLMLFRHDYESPNMLQLLQNPGQLQDGSVIEVVLSSRNDGPSRPHSVSVHSYLTPTFCDFCGEMLLGLTKQGLRCINCQLNFHKKCAYAYRNNCSSPAAAVVCVDQPHHSHHQSSVNGNNGSLQQQRHPAAILLPHTFVVHSYVKPTVCKVCNQLLVGLVKQGLQCRDCKVNVHKRCASAIANDCYAAASVDAAVIAASRSSLNESSMMDTTDPSPITPTSSMVVQSGHSAAVNEMIPVQRLPGQVAFKHDKTPAVIIEGWMVHFTSIDIQRRLRHYWILEPHCLTLFNDGMHRKYLTIPLFEIVGVKGYSGPPIDPSFPPHCFEIQTRNVIYYVGENLDYYKEAANRSNGGSSVAKLPRRESGVGLASASRWLEALAKALLPPPSHREQAEGEAALEFSQIYQVNPSEELGSGQFGTVYGGVHRQSGHRVAIKVIAKERFGKKQKEQLRGEVAILQAVSHPGIIRLEAMFETSDKIFVVMEQMRADMLEMILSSRNGRLNERITKFLIVQILGALRYLHSKDIAHCDLKPENVLLSSNDTDYPQTKLCDFGYARFIGESQFRKTVVGTPAYLAPEVLLKKGYNKSLDMWSVGVIIYVTLSGTFPFNEGEEIGDQIQNASFMYPNDPWGEIDRSAIDLISRLLKVKIEERQSIDECLSHDWLVGDKQLYSDLRSLETRLNCRYLTNPADDSNLATAGI